MKPSERIKEIRKAAVIKEIEHLRSQGLQVGALSPLEETSVWISAILAYLDEKAEQGKSWTNPS